jgi:hypothetical protein
MAIAVCGLIALLIFLIGDLPDVNKIGTLDDPRQSFIDAEAKPVAGFWLELVGSLVLTVCGAALATLKPGAEVPRDHEGRRRRRRLRARGESLQAPLGREDPPYQR